MVDNNGRQTGNAVFSIYPILSSHTAPLDKTIHCDFEAATIAVIDVGAASVTVVSAQLPQSLSPADQKSIAVYFSTLAPELKNTPLLVACNHAPAQSVVKADIFYEIPTAKPLHETHLWATPSPHWEVVSTSDRSTDLGPVLLYQLSFYR
jgi:hypothetical protein